MAGIDLYGGDAERVRNQYRTSLGRDASDDEVSGWLSGSYGGGSLDQRLNQIAGSHEAQQFRPSAQPPSTTPITVGQNPYQPMTPPPDQRQGLQNVYRTSLGRDASDDEITNWLSGAYGYGSGPQDYDKFVQAIMGSPEARNYRPQYTGDPNLRTLDYWQSQGVPNIDIFDPLTGQLKPGWQRTARGYERTGGGTSPTTPGGGPQGGDLQSWVMSLLGNGPSSPDALGALEAQLNQRGIRLQKDSFGVIRGRLYMPDGSVVDVVPNGGWGQPWQWIARGAGGGHGGGPGGGGISGVNLPQMQFNDPYTRLLEEMMQARIGSLQSGNDAGLQRLLQFFEQRFNDLKTPGYTGAENEAIRTGALDPIERDRAAARRRALERISAMGYTLESGVAQQLLQEIDREFDSMRAQTQTQLTTNDLARREGRMQQAGSMATSLYEIPQARAREALGYAGALSDLGPQRLQLAMQALGAGGTPQSMFQSLMQLAQMNQNSALLDAQRSGQTWNALGQMAAILMNAGR